MLQSLPLKDTLHCFEEDCKYYTYNDEYPRDEEEGQGRIMQEEDQTWSNIGNAIGVTQVYCMFVAKGS